MDRLLETLALLGLSVGVVSLGVHLVVLRAALRRGVKVPGWARGMPWYLYRACAAQLPASASNRRLCRVSYWSTAGGLLGWFLGVAAGTLLGGL